MFLCLALWRQPQDRSVRITFLGQKSNWKSTLHFFSRFDTSMEKERYNQRLHDHKSRMTTPILETRLQIEKHVAQIYTRESFYVLQKETLFHNSNTIVDTDKDNGGEFKLPEVWKIIFFSGCSSSDFSPSSESVQLLYVESTKTKQFDIEKKRPGLLNWNTQRLKERETWN